jgi:uncharacterized UPF0160 family protein
MGHMVSFRSFGTHDGTFHADEVTACALLIHYGLIDKEKVIRTRKKELLDQCEFVCDVGGEYDPSRKKFDHHQVSYQGNLSSAGMVWAYLREQKIVDEALYHYLNRSLIQGVDAHDNGKILDPISCSFSHIISNFVPIQYDASSQEQDAAFFCALDFVLGHLQRFMDRYDYVRQCKEKVLQAMEKGGAFLSFDESLPWIDLFFEMGGEAHPAQFVVMPSGDRWKVRAIPPNNEDRMNVRTPLPEQWAGLLEEQLQKVSGIEGAVFCHKGRFISVWKTKKDALQALDYILSEKK